METKTEKSEYELNADAFAEKHGIILTLLDHDYKKYFADDKEPRYVWKCKLTRNKRNYTFEFGQSIAAGEEQPNMYDILVCLQKNDVGTLEDFCDEFGYDTDSIQANKTYKAVCKEFKAVENIFGDIIEELQEIQ